MKLKIALFVVLVVAFLIRSIGLDTVPPSLISDELLMSYDGASIYHTGQDHYGVSYPIFFKQSGEYRPPLYIYFAGFFTGPFGINPHSARIPSAILGVLSIWIAFLFCKEVFGQRAAWITALLITFSPWHIHYSRTGWEMISLVVMQLLVFWSMFRWYNHKHTIDLILAAVFLALTIYTYPTARVGTPILIIGLILIFYQPLWQNKKSTLMAAIFFCVVTLPYVYMLTENYYAMQARWQFLSVFQLPNGWYQFLLHYLWHINPVFLFWRGDANPLHSMPGGLALTVLFPFFCMGFYQAIRQRSPIYMFLLFWFFTFAIPSSMTYDRYHLHSMPNALRSTAGIPLLEIFSAIGLLIFVDKILPQRWRQIGISTIIMALFINFAVIAYSYMGPYRIQSAPSWQYGIQELVHYSESNKHKYDRVIISHQVRLHPIALATYSGLQPQPFTGNDFPKYIIPFYNYVRVYQDFGHQTYTQYGSIARWYNVAPGKNLLVAKAGEIEAQPIHQITSLNGEVLYECFATNRK